MSDVAYKLLQLAIVLAVFGAVIGALLLLVDRAPKRGREKFQLGVFLLPALVLLTVGLVVPAVRTASLSFFDARGENFIGLENYVWMFTNPDAIVTLRNTMIWVILVPLLATGIGLAYAIFIDKARGEAALKSLVFMPMAISFVGAGIIWRFVYEYRGGSREQIGVLNQLVVSFGGEPRRFIQDSPENTLWLIVVMIWIQTGFAMVVLSAAIKGIPAEIIEASRIDGANAWQQFRNVTLPGIRPSLIVVLTTISIGVLKVFDIVRTMTGGQNDTSVVANEMFFQAFVARDNGKGAALALAIFVLVLPIVIYNARALRQRQEDR